MCMPEINVLAIKLRLQLHFVMFKGVEESVGNVWTNLIFICNNNTYCQQIW